MIFRFSSKWSIILSIFINLLSNQVSSVNPRSNGTLQTEKTQAELDFDDDLDNEGQQNGVTNDYEGTTDIMEERFSSQNKEKRSDNSSLHSWNHNGEIVKRAADLELAEFELEKVERNVENEIINLKKRYNNKVNSRKRGINKNYETISSPRLTKIRVETYEIGHEPVAGQSTSNERRDRSSSLVITNITEHSTITTATPETNNEKENKTRVTIENTIQKKIDAIKKKVKRLVADEQKHNKIRRNNARFNEMRRLISIGTKSQSYNKLSKSSKKMASSLEKRSMNRKSTSISKRDRSKKFITKKTTHHAPDKLAHRPERKHDNSKGVLPADLDRQLQQISTNPEGTVNRRLTRRLRKPPDNSKQLQRFSRRLQKPPDNSQKLHRTSRRLRKPPGNQITSLDKVQTDRKVRGVTNAQNVTTNPNFLFHENPHRKKPVHTNQIRHSHAPERKPGTILKHQHQKQRINRLTNNDEPGHRKERAVNTPLDRTNSDQVAESNSPNDVINARGINSHLVSEYSDAFGGFPSDSDDTSLLRYKRVKRL